MTIASIAAQTVVAARRYSNGDHACHHGALAGTAAIIGMVKERGIGTVGKAPSMLTV
jgi:hypothetical protein